MTRITSADYAKQLGMDRYDMALVSKIIEGKVPLPLRCYPERIRRFVAYVRETQQRKTTEATRYSSV